MAADRDQHLTRSPERPQGDQLLSPDALSDPARIEHEIMRTRAALDETLAELRRRLSGDYVRHEVRAHPAPLIAAGVVVAGVVSLTVIGAVRRAQSGHGILGLLASAALGAATGLAVARSRRH